MPKCPNCGSTAQVFPFDYKSMMTEESVVVIREYECGCGHHFKTEQTYKDVAGEKIVEK